MKIFNKRMLVEIGVVSLVMMVLTSSYVARKESVVGKSEGEILRMAIEKNDYELAQKIYENSKRSDLAGVPTRSDLLNLENVLGAMSEAENIEMTIYPEKKVAAEIERLESLLASYPTYPPLLTQLQQLYVKLGDTENAEKYERELQRLNIR